MSTTSDLKELERRAWKSVFQDGLWDIFIGMLLLAGAISSLLSYVGVRDGVRIVAYLPVMVLAGVGLWAGKRFITVPRMGRVKFGPEREARRQKARLVIFVSLIVVWALFLLVLAFESGWLERPEWWQIGGKYIGSTVVILNFLVIFGAMAHLLEFKRLYLYGVLMCLPEVLGVGLQELAGIKIGFLIGDTVAAAIVLSIGVVLLARFLRDYPVLAGPPEEALNGTR